MGKTRAAGNFGPTPLDAETKEWLDQGLTGLRQLGFIAAAGAIMLLTSLVFVQLGLI